MKSQDIPHTSNTTKYCLILSILLSAILSLTSCGGSGYTHISGQFVSTAPDCNYIISTFDDGSENIIQLYAAEDTDIDFSDLTTGDIIDIKIVLIQDGKAISYTEVFDYTKEKDGAEEDIDSDLLSQIYQLNSSFESTENAYKETVVTYLEAMKEGTEKAVEYAAFPNETIKADYLQSPIRISDYEIVSSESVNDHLYAFTLNIISSDEPDASTTVYYFVGHQDGKYTVYINASYVPETLQENLNLDDYSYDDPDDLGSTPEFAD